MPAVLRRMLRQKSSATCVVKLETIMQARCMPPTNAPTEVNKKTSKMKLLPQRHKKLRFCDTAKVRRVTYKNPSDYFYTLSDVER